MPFAYNDIQLRDRWFTTFGLTGDDVFFPQAFGAVGDGTTDDTAAFNALIAAIPAATPSAICLTGRKFIIKTALTALPANTALVGTAEYVTQISTSLASGTLITMSGANSTLSNILINNTNTSNTAAALAISATQCTVENVSFTGFGNTTATVNMTSGATFANFYNVFWASTVASSVCLNIAGNDTTIQGCTFNGTGGTMTGIACAANDRYAVVDCIFEQCSTGVSLTATTANGSTTFSGLAFNTCGTGFSITPTTGQTVQEIVLDGCTFFTSTTAGISIAPLLTGVVKNIVIDGCTCEASAAGSGIIINVGGTGTTSNITIEGCIISGNGDDGVTLTTGATACTLTGILISDCILQGNTTDGIELQIGATSTLSNVTMADCLIIGNTANGVEFVGTVANMTQVVGIGCTFSGNGATVIPALGGATSYGNNGFRECPGLTGTFSPIGTVPGFPATTVVQANNTGLDIQACVTNGTSAMTVVKGGPSGTTTLTGFAPQASVSFVITIPFGNGIAFTYGGGAPSWSWVN